jgi:hypothetical protein
VGRGASWCVELEDFDHDRFDEITAAVRHWLGEIDLASAR